MQRNPKPVFISKYDDPPPATVPGSDSPALNPQRISGRVENTLAHKTARLVESHPEDAVRVLREWLCQD